MGRGGRGRLHAEPVLLLARRRVEGEAQPLGQVREVARARAAHAEARRLAQELGALAAELLDARQVVARHARPLEQRTQSLAAARVPLLVVLRTRLHLESLDRLLERQQHLRRHSRPTRLPRRGRAGQGGAARGGANAARTRANKGGRGHDARSARLLHAQPLAGLRLGLVLHLVHGAVLRALDAAVDLLDAADQLRRAQVERGGVGARALHVVRLVEDQNVVRLRRAHAPRPRRARVGCRCPGT